MAQPAPAPAPALVEPADLETFADAVEVRELALYVRVRTKRSAVEGLRRESFEVRLGKLDLPIVAFEELQTATRREERRTANRRLDEQGSAEPTRQGRSLLFVIDLAWTPRGYAQYAVDSVRRTLGTLSELDRVGLVLLTSSAHLIHPLTTNRNVNRAGLDLLEAILDAKGRQVTVRLRALEVLLAEEQGDPFAGLGLRGLLTLGDPAAALNSGLPAAALLTGRPLGRFDDGGNPFAITEELAKSLSIGRAQDSNEALATLARALGDVPAPRYLFLMSRGQGNFSALLTPNLSASVAPTPMSDFLRSYRDLTSALISAGWVAQAIDVTGIGGRGTSYDPQDNAPRTLNSAGFSQPGTFRGGLADNGSDSLFYTAKRTGGDLYDNYNNLDLALKKSVADASHHYRLIVSLPSGTELARGALPEVDAIGAPRGAKVRVSSAADWLLPDRLRARLPSDRTRLELLGLRPTQPAFGQLVILPLGEPRGAYLRALVLAEIPRRNLASLSDSAGAKVHVVALPAEGSSVLPAGEVLDLWAGTMDLGSRDTTSASSSSELLSIVGDLLLPCDDSVVRVRVGLVDGFVDSVTARGLCAGSGAWILPLVPMTERLSSWEPGLDLDSFRPADDRWLTPAVPSLEFGVEPDGEVELLLSQGAMPLEGSAGRAVLQSIDGDAKYQLSVEIGAPSPSFPTLHHARAVLRGVPPGQYSLHPVVDGRSGTGLATIQVLAPPYKPESRSRAPRREAPSKPASPSAGRLGGRASAAHWAAGCRK